MSKVLEKKELIIVRVTPKMKLQIEMLAEESKRTVSNYLRLVFEDIIEKNKKIRHTLRQ